MSHAVLTSEAHRDLRISTLRGADFGDQVMTCLTVPAEFRQVQNEYPILFRLTPERDAYHAYALFGFQNGENLFLKGDRWDARYRPLAMDIQPFLIGLPNDGSEKQVHIDLDSARIAQGEGVRVFDDHGKPTPFMENMAEKLGELDAGYQGGKDFFATLMRMELFEPLALDITLNNGETYRFVGFSVINEDRLAALEADDIAELHRKDYLLPIHMALASLSNIAAMVDRKNAQLTSN